MFKTTTTSPVNAFGPGYGPSDCCSVTQAPVPAEPRVLSALNRLQFVVGTTHDLVNALEARLSAVLRAVPPSKGDAASGQPSCEVPLGDAMHGLSQSLEHAHSRLRDMLDRLEV